MEQRQRGDAAVIFPTRPAALQQPLPYPGGPFMRELPAVPLLVELSGPSVRGLALVDTTADSIILPESVAQQLHVDLNNAPSGPVAVIGGTQVPVCYAQLILTLQTARQSCRWPA